MHSALFVPSFRRAKRLLEKRGTLDLVSKSWKKKVYLVVRDEEKDEYHAVAKKFGVHLLPMPKSEDTENRKYGITNTRDYILEFGISEFKHIIMFDDDFDIRYRPDLEKGPSVRVNDKTFDEGMERLTSTSRDIPIMGFQIIAYSNGFKTEYKDNCRVSETWAFHSGFFRDNPQYRFKALRLRFMSDLFMGLITLTHGVPNRVWCRWLYGQSMQSPGGCSVTRNPENLEECARRIVKKFPEICTLMEKELKGEKYYGVRTRWSKAFNLYARKGKKDA